ETLDSFLGTVTTQYEKDTSKSTDKAEATIVAGQNVTAALTDTYTTKTTPATGSLTVSKTISGAPLEDFEKLTFTAVGDKGTTLTIPDLTKANVENGKWTNEGNGKYTYTVSDLTPDEKFTVTETLDSFLGTVTTQYEKDTSKSTDKAEATIVGGQNVTAALTDTYTVKQAPVPTGSISITKSVVGTDPTSGSFTFTVKCGDDYVQDTTGTVASAYADFTITDGETIDITGLELGKVYVVAEDEVTGLASGIVCTTTYSDSDKVVLDANTTSGLVTITNTFTDTNVPNPTTGSITVTKLVTGSTTSGMPDKYKFYIECGDQYVQQDGSLGDTKYLFEVGANSDVTIDNLDTNTKTYKVVEDTVDTSALPSGYACDEPSYSTPTITLDPNNESGSVVITNNFTYTAPNPVPVTGSLKITLDLDGEVPSDAPNKTFVFEVTGPSYPNGTTIYITGEDDLTIDNLLPGTYKVVESRPDAEITNYDLSVSGHDGISIDVVAGETATRTIVNEYTYNPPKPQPPTKGDITFTKTFGGDVTEREAAGDNLYFVITNENGEYLALDGTLSSTEVRITLADLDHTDGTRIWTKTINDVPLGRYTVTEHNDEIFIGGSNIPYTMEATSVRTDSTSIDSSSLSGNLDLTNIYVNGPDLDITLSKQDIAGKEIAEAELTFTSLDGYDLSNVVVTQNGVQVKVTISPDKHAISFITVDTAPSIIKGLRAGRYELKETVTPKAYLTAEAIQFSLLPDGSTECGGKVTVAGSPIIMVDKADPNYEVDKDTEVISANREPKSIPATGETASIVSKAGIAVLSLSAACFTGYFVYNAKKRKAEEE
ncbi:MAG: hypothetical protein IKO15_04575, partial [Clostridiales bacterium]|nr:hypothetical protein [Clostridiales bacterium]